MVVSIARKGLAFLLVIIYIKKCSFYFIGRQMSGLFCSLLQFHNIFLFFSADGKYEVTLMTKARLNYTGEIEWKPPAIYKSSCKINVEWFPFDEQSCDMKVDIQLNPKKFIPNAWGHGNLARWSKFWIQSSRCIRLLKKFLGGGGVRKYG